MASNAGGLLATLASTLEETDQALLERLREGFGDGVLRQALLEAERLHEEARLRNEDGSPRSVRQLFFLLLSQHARAIGTPLWQITRPEPQGANGHVRPPRLLLDM